MQCSRGCMSSKRHHAACGSRSRRPPPSPPGARACPPRPQERLAALLPRLAAQKIAPGAPSWLQWAFACVRSRTVRLAEDVFALAPFVDLANHAADPTADFMASPDGQSVQLVALKALQPGQVGGGGGLQCRQSPAMRVCAQAPVAAVNC
jgi:hypothetical protein